MQNPKAPPPTEGLARIWAKLAELDRRLSNSESYFNGGAAAQVPVVDALPPAGRLGRLVILRADGKLWRDDSTTWVAVG
jgi:hypothetical protein